MQISKTNSQEEIELKANKIYKIIKIHPDCEWYSERKLFEGKIMECREFSTKDQSGGFAFVKSIDCDRQYDPRKLFCFLNPIIKEII